MWGTEAEKERKEKKIIIIIMIMIRPGTQRRSCFRQEEGPKEYKIFYRLDRKKMDQIMNLER
jgi:hypothetical protein